jgi:hypothetical protein
MPLASAAWAAVGEVAVPPAPVSRAMSLDLVRDTAARGLLLLTRVARVRVEPASEMGSRCSEVRWYEELALLPLPPRQHCHRRLRKGVGMYVGFGWRRRVHSAM